ncbi:hypothetical protein [Alteraurantiacibacter buctensis]|uniref:hypothetical protein n=1 Tax=Alteraurantiacibacter buctensis TaxID=1503981 RepID=UPI00136DD4F6|nr:hypothetical protein [Alteraurantiacibacter buctensis]
MSPYPSRRPAAVPAIDRPSNPAAEAAFVASWLAHVEAGRIGNRTPMPPEELAVQRANEMAVLGRTPSFLDLPAPQPPRRRWGR